MGSRREADRDMRFFGATDQYQGVVDERMAELFPLVNNMGSESVDQFLAGEIHHISFPIPQTGKLGRLERIIINHALRLALDESNQPHFSLHGAQHAAYEGVIKAVLSHLPEVTASLDERIVDKKYYSDTGKVTVHPVRVQRLVLQTPVLNVESGRPSPHQQAIELQRLENTGSRKAVIKKLRAAAREHGIGYALMVASYFLMPPEEIEDILSEENLKNSLKQKRLPVLNPKEPLHRSTVRNIYNYLTESDGYNTYPTFDPDNYRFALKKLVEWGWIREEVEREKIYGFVPYNFTARGLVVMLGASDVAHNEAPAEFIDPARTQFIDNKFGKISTSQVVTAYWAEV